MTSCDSVQNLCTLAATIAVYCILKGLLMMSLGTTIVQWYRYISSLLLGSFPFSWPLISLYMPVKGLSLKVRVFITEYTNILKAVQCLHQHPWWGNRCWSSLLITSLWGLEAFIYFLLFLNHGIHSWVPHLRKYYHSNLELWAGMVMVFVIMTIKGHCATHLKVTGWHHLQHCKSGSLQMVSTCYLKMCSTVTLYSHNYKNHNHSCSEF